jgi:hypothetical protein
MFGLRAHQPDRGGLEVWFWEVTWMCSRHAGDVASPPPMGDRMFLLENGDTGNLPLVEFPDDQFPEAPFAGSLYS